jgi:hypothetical protein
VRPDALHWRRGFDALERLIGERLEELVLTRTFNDLLALTLRGQSAARGVMDRQTGAVLHFWNLPTRSDVSKLRRQVGAVGFDVRELALPLEEDAQRPAAAGPRDGRMSRRREHHSGRSHR